MGAPAFFVKINQVAERRKNSGHRKLVKQGAHRVSVDGRGKKCHVFYACDSGTNDWRVKERGKEFEVPS